MILWRLLGCATVLISAHVLTMSVTSQLLGFAPSVTRLFLGPRVLHVTVGRTRYELGLVPLGGFVRHGDDEVSPLPPLRRVVVLLSGNLVLLALGGWLADLQAPWLSRAEVAALLLEHPRRALGWCALAVAAVNLLPLGAFNGGQALEALAAHVTGRAVRLPMWVNLVGGLATLALVLTWWVR